ncbi:MAG: DUF4177 domain-containing protein [Pseudomonadota bacterium]
MPIYEYRAVPAPRKGKSDKGVKGNTAKFANAITHLMNDMAAQGWDYLRADTLPCEERQGLTSKVVKYHSMLVFRRAVESAEEDATALALPSPEEAFEAPSEEEFSDPTQDMDEDALELADDDDMASEAALSEDTAAR